MSVTFEIHQENCTGCATCVKLSQEEIKINDDEKAYFVKTGDNIANFGPDRWPDIFAARDECPSECIEEIG